MRECLRSNDEMGTGVDTLCGGRGQSDRAEECKVKLTTVDSA